MLRYHKNPDEIRFLFRSDPFLIIFEGEGDPSLWGLSPALGRAQALPNRYKVMPLVFAHCLTSKKNKIQWEEVLIYTHFGCH